MIRTKVLAVIAAGGVLAAGLAAPALAAPSGTLVAIQAPSDAVGTVDATVYLPPGYQDESRRYPTLYLLHGRGDTQQAWQRVAGDLDDMIAAGTIQPMVVVMPDAPWSDRASWYVDSRYRGGASGAPEAGAAVETALTRDLVGYVDATYRTVADRDARAVGGYSMGGAGALRYVLAHADEFSSAIVLSPAVYVPLPPADSSTRDYGAFGVGRSLFSPAVYRALNYPRALDRLDPATPVHLFIAVGDDEYANPAPKDAVHDLDYEAVRLYTAARRVPGVTAELRVLDGGHDWDVWQPAFREAIVDISARLHTAPAAPWSAALLGSAADDRAGGVVPQSDGGDVVALAAGDAMGGLPAAGGLDVDVVRRDAEGQPVWWQQIATAQNDRAYGAVAGADGGTLVAGYTRGDLDGAHQAGVSDDGFVVALGADGSRQWTTQLGDPSAADRFYATASDGAGGALVAGYTSGSFAGTPSAGDKDAVVARVDADGQLVWSLQLGGPGEDKALAVAAEPDGGAVVAGVAGGAMPGQVASGGGDGWLAKVDADGQLVWLVQQGTSAADQLQGIAVRADGTVVATGWTDGDLAGSSGGRDVIVSTFTADGSPVSTTQTGSAGDDQGVGLAVAPDGTLVLVGVTDGALGDPVGGQDVFTATVADGGALSSITQFGSIARDGADEWSEANLLIGVAAGRVELTGLTLGAPDGAESVGGGDVFVQDVTP